MSESIDSTLQERGSRYGKFTSHALITQGLKRACVAGEHVAAQGGKVTIVHTNWNDLDDFQREALEMICHKMGRILNGDPNYDDSWRDIAGYAELVVKELNGEGV